MVEIRVCGERGSVGNISDDQIAGTALEYLAYLTL